MHPSILAHHVTDKVDIFCFEQDPKEDNNLNMNIKAKDASEAEAPQRQLGIAGTIGRDSGRCLQRPRSPGGPAGARAQGGVAAWPSAWADRQSPHWAAVQLAWPLPTPAHTPSGPGLRESVSRPPVDRPEPYITGSHPGASTGARPLQNKGCAASSGRRDSPETEGTWQRSPCRTLYPPCSRVFWMGPSGVCC
ncbi:unnamed protein product [Lota lota]